MGARRIFTGMVRCPVPVIAAVKQAPRRAAAANGVRWILAPNGVISNMCAANPGDGLVVLRGCNGSNFQLWIATPATGVAGFQTWANGATHRMLQSGSRGQQLATVAPPTTPTPSQQWRFVG